MGLACVIHKGQAVRPSHLAEEVQATRIAIEVDRESGPSPARDAALHLPQDRDTPFGVNVRKYRCRATVRDRPRRGDKGKWCRDDLVTGLHTHGEQSQMQRSRSRAHCDTVAASP